MKPLSTHRLIQIHSLMDVCESMESVNKRCASKALDLGKLKQWAYFMKKQCKAGRIANRCRYLLGISR